MGIQTSSASREHIHDAEDLASQTGAGYHRIDEDPCA